MLAAPDRRPDPLTAFRVARGWFLAGRRIEMQELAAELGVNRATLFRWVGSRDDLLAEIIWSLAEPTLKHAIDESSGLGGLHILRREPERSSASSSRSRTPTSSPANNSTSAKPRKRSPRSLCAIEALAVFISPVARRALRRP